MREIKEKIASTKQMSKITKAMQMVAAARLNRAQLNAQNYAAYADKLREVIASIASAMPKGDSSKHPMLATRPVKRTAYLVLTENRGLAGAYDSNVLKYVQNKIREKHQSPDEYMVIVTGKIGQKFFTKRNYPVAFSKTDVADEINFDDAVAFARKVIDLFNTKKVDELHLIYNHFVNAISQTVEDKQLLPLTNLTKSPVKKTNYIYEPDEDEVLKSLLPLYAEGQIYGALLDAKAAEQAARMTAMRSASDNASDIIDHLSLSYNRARQAAITQEITEIVGGAAALE
jgi:F-type H+-transporting ATPase subunit gamma